MLYNSQGPGLSVFKFDKFTCPSEVLYIMMYKAPQTEALFFWTVEQRKQEDRRAEKHWTLDKTISQLFCGINSKSFI